MAAGTGATGQPGGWVVRAVAGLPPASFAFVMATGIVSTGVFLLGPAWLSRALLVVACAGLVVLGVALVARLVWFRDRVMADVRSPQLVFGFFTVVAGLDVVGVRIDFAGHPMVAVVLAAVAGAIWLVLTYGIPAGLLLNRSADSVLGGINGTWLLWVVATQSLSTLAAVLAIAFPARADVLGPFAVGFWAVGLILYLTLVSLILLRWLTVPVTPETLGPPYWILMGATAITVLAGARILSLPATLPVRQATASVVEGLSFVLWAFGTWWIPLLVILGVWRHTRHRWPLRYETALWSVVFPLGMYSVATYAYGHVAHLGFMAPLARVMVWVAVAAWLLVALAPAAQFLWDRERQGGR